MHKSGNVARRARATSSFSEIDGYAPFSVLPAPSHAFATSGNDRLIGTDGDDVFDGLEGDDFIDGRNGNDRIDGGMGADTLSGGLGDDVVDGGDGNDVISELALGNDILRGGDGDDTITAVSHGHRQVLIEGGAGDDVVSVKTYQDDITIDLGTGDDYLNLFAYDALDKGRRTIMLGRGVDTVHIDPALPRYPGFDVAAAATFTDFRAGNGGDIFDFHDYADAALNDGHYPDYNPFAEGRASLVQSGRDVMLRTDGGILAIFRNTRVADFVDGNFGYDLDAPSPPGETFTGTEGRDVHYGTGRSDTIMLLGGNDSANGLLGDDAIDGGDGDDGLDGAQGDDVLRGGLGADYLDGGAGADRLEGGEGNDHIAFSDNLDSIDGGAGFDIFTIGFGVADNTGFDLDLTNFLRDGSFLLGGIRGVGIERFDIAYGSKGNDRLLYGALWSAGVELHGFLGNDTLLSSNGASHLYGDDGDDRLTGLAGYDVLVGGEGNDRLSGGGNNDSLDGGNGDDILIGDDGDDTLSGGAGKDLLVGGAGDDLLILGHGVASGGAGDDRISIDTLGVGDSVDGGAGRDTLSIFGSTRNLYVDLSNLTSRGQVLIGGTVVAATGFELVEVGLTGGNNTVIYGPDYRYDVQVVGAGGKDRIVGGSGTDRLYGGDGADILDGGAGADLLNGGRGSDTYYVDSAGDVINEGGSDGDVDRVFASIDYHLDYEIENATLTGAANLDLQGNSGDNVLTGNSGDNVIDGGDGIDTIAGGAGFDTASYASYSSSDGRGVTIDLSETRQTTGNAKGEILTSIEAVEGSSAADVLTGNERVNVLTGGGGNDRLNGGGGSDRLYGGTGDDVLVGGTGDDLLDGGDGIDLVNYGAAAAAVRIDLQTGRATSGTERDQLVGIESVTGSAFGDEIIGGDSGGVLFGASGNDILHGGVGNDDLNGGDGIDTVVYDLATSGVTVSLALTQGQYTTGAGYDSIEQVENLTGSAFDDVLYGAANANVVDGQGGNDIIEGGLGNDTLIGGAGFDVASYDGATSAVTVDLGVASAQDTRAEGWDTLSGIEGLAGSQYDDRLIGDSGDNLLAGGSGDDILTGGGGADRFLLTSIPDVDTITDFVHGTDQILLAASTVGLTPGTLSSEMFRLGSVAQDADDRVLYDPGTGKLYFDVDGVGGYDAIQIASLSASLPISASDFFIV